MAENRWSFVSETIEDGTEIAVGEPFKKVWIIKNAGSTKWTSNYRLRYAKNEMMAGETSYPLGQSVAPGGQVTIEVPMTAPRTEGNYFSHWQLLDETGTPLRSQTTSGTTYLWVEINAVPAEQVAVQPKEDISFWLWEGETIEDNIELASGTKITKTWTLRNAGPATWTTDYTLRFVGDDTDHLLAPEKSYPLPHKVAPDEMVTIEVPMIVPDTKGIYQSYWSLFDAQGNTVPMKSKRLTTVIWAKINAIPASEIKGSNWLLLDETIPDGTGIPINEEFTKSWTFRNTGPATWTTKYRLRRVHSADAQLGKVDEIFFDRSVIPGDSVVLSVPMVVPSEPGQYTEKWEIVDEDGKAVASKKWKNFTKFYVEIAALSDHVADGFCWPGGDIDNPDRKWGGWRDAQPFKHDYRSSAAQAKRSPFFHPGGDLNGPGWGDADLGLPIHSIGHGIVVFSDDVNVWGNIILIEHVMFDGTQFWSQYAHMQDVYVKKGDKVFRGDKIGTVGKGDDERYVAHLHFEIRKRYISASAWGGVVYNEVNLMKYYVDPLVTIQKYFFTKFD